MSTDNITLWRHASGCVVAVCVTVDSFLAKKSSMSTLSTKENERNCVSVCGGKWGSRGGDIGSEPRCASE
jgi:hypothetical protein